MGDSVIASTRSTARDWLEAASREGKDRTQDTQAWLSRIRWHSKKCSDWVRGKWRLEGKE